MFGHDLEPADGTIVDIYDPTSNINAGTSKARYLIDVRPQHGDMFRMEIGLPHFSTDFRPPGVGQVVKMKCDVKHQTAHFDKSDPGLKWDHSTSPDKVRFDTALKAGPTPAAPKAAVPIESHPSTPSEAQRTQITAAQVLATGMPTRVRLVQTEPIGRKNAAGIDLYALVLLVQHDDGRDPTQFTVGNPVPADCVALLYPGSSLPAKVLPSDDNAIVVDWDAARLTREANTSTIAEQT